MLKCQLYRGLKSPKYKKIWLFELMNGIIKTDDHE